jgi:ribosome modulation factor
MLPAPGLRRARLLAALMGAMTRPVNTVADRDGRVCPVTGTGGRMRLIQGWREAAPQLGGGMLAARRPPT